MTPGMPGAERLTEAWAVAADAADPMTLMRDRFRLPDGPGGSTATYLAGHSLGAQPRAAVEAVMTQLEAWGRLGVEGHFRPGSEWVDADGVAREMTARLVGARPAEVATMNTLTVNLHLLMASFFRPSGSRTAILIDAPTFPSDRYAVGSQLRLHGLDPARELIVVGPRSGESIVRVEDLEAAIADAGDRLAMTLLAGVNYATGQVQAIPRLTAAARSVGAVTAWDLAHAAGNIPLSLHDWDVDVAAWCTYKYLNSGPGAVGQVFVHERHGADRATLRLAGWWGNEPTTRFRMADTFEAGAGADGWRVSNPPILSLAPIAASLAIFDEIGMGALRARSERLTAYLADLIEGMVPEGTIITPTDRGARGAMLAIRLPDARRVLERLEQAAIVADFREPDIIRIAPVPLYNGYLDCWRAANELGRAVA